MYYPAIATDCQPPDWEEDQEGFSFGQKKNARASGLSFSCFKFSAGESKIMRSVRWSQLCLQEISDKDLCHFGGQPCSQDDKRDHHDHMITHALREHMHNPRIVG